MRRPTDLMRSILTNPMAQEIIDYVSPIYGDSYVGLWMFQAIGGVLWPIDALCTSLMEETTPATATFLLDQWEDHYNLPRDSRLVISERQSRLVRKILSCGPCNPITLATAVSAALGGIQVDIEERVAKNTFAVILYESVPDLTPAQEVLERMKPAHLIYEIRIASPTASTAQVNVGIATTLSEKFVVEVTQ